MWMHLVSSMCRAFSSSWEINVASSVHSLSVQFSSVSPRRWVCAIQLLYPSSDMIHRPRLNSWGIDWVQFVCWPSLRTHERPSLSWISLHIGVGECVSSWFGSKISCFFPFFSQWSSIISQSEGHCQHFSAPIFVFFAHLSAPRSALSFPRRMYASLSGLCSWNPYHHWVSERLTMGHTLCYTMYIMEIKRMI